MSTVDPGTSRSAVWLSAMRPRTLPLALASIIMGSSLAAAEGAFHWIIALLCVLTAVLLQILSNLANDYGDSQHGADRAERLGPPRAVQSGAVTPAMMRRAMLLMALLSAVSGLLLIWVSLGPGALVAVLIFAGLGIAAILAALAYTSGSRPYGYAGLGDIAVLVFFGWVGVTGSYFLQTTHLSWLVLLPATSCGLLTVAVLNVNNIRDIDSDRIAGKRSVPVRLGLEKARLYHWLLLALSVLFALAYVLLDFNSVWQLLFVLAIPFLVRNGLAVSRTDDLPTLNPWLKQMSVATLVFVVLFGLGQVLGSAV